MERTKAYYDELARRKWRLAGGAVALLVMSTITYDCLNWDLRRTVRKRDYAVLRTILTDPLPDSLSIKRARVKFYRPGLIPSPDGGGWGFPRTRTDRRVPRTGAGWRDLSPREQRTDRRDRPYPPGGTARDSSRP